MPIVLLPFATLIIFYRNEGDPSCYAEAGFFKIIYMAIDYDALKSVTLNGYCFADLNSRLSMRAEGSLDKHWPRDKKDRAQ